MLFRAEQESGGARSGLQRVHNRFARTVAVAGLVCGMATGASLLVGAAQAGAATTLTVTDCSGSPTDTGSLPFLINKADGHSGDAIVFAKGLDCGYVGNGAFEGIDITNSLDITSPMTIVATGGNAVLGVLGSNMPAFVVSANATISGFDIEQNNIDNGNSGQGAGVTINAGTVSLADDRFFEEDASLGGAVYNAAGATAIITGSSFYADQAFEGGAVYNAGTAIITNNSFMLDNAFRGGAVYDQGYGTIGGDTFFDNSYASGGAGASLYVAGNATTTLTASVIEQDQNPGDASCGTVASQVLIDGGYNVESDNTCGFSNTSHYDNAAIGLGNPALNGNDSFAESDAPTEQSSAFDEVPPSVCAVVATTDQRGFPRPGIAGHNCDAGALEIETTTLTPSTMASAGSAGHRFSATLQLNNHAPLVGLGVFVVFSFQGKTLCGSYTNASGVATCTSKVDNLVLDFDKFNAKDTYLASYGGDGAILASTANGKL